MSTAPLLNHYSVLASTVSTVKKTVGREKGLLEWENQRLLTVGTELESLSMHSVGSRI